MKKRWWLAGSCMFVLAAAVLPVQGFAAVRGPEVKAADLVTALQSKTCLEVASYGERAGTAGGFPIDGGTMDDPYQEGGPYDDRFPDMQTDDLQGDIPAQDDLNQEEPYQVVPPEGDCQEEPPLGGDQPSE